MINRFTIDPTMNYFNYIKTIIEKLESLENEVKELRKELKSRPRMDSGESTGNSSVESFSSNQVIRFEVYKKSVRICGGLTMTYKDKLKTHYCKWNPNLMSWITTKENGAKLALRFKKKMGEKCIIGDGVIGDDDSTSIESGF